jgi:anthranilate synthase/aminodeoxychorismate synthase-like glutamine amidotransferase
VILLIDNYDSFTWNLVQKLGEARSSLRVGRDLVVVRNDEVTAEQVETMNAGGPPERIVLSPGPCTPREAGVCGDVIARFAERVPILGVCLGHQTIGFAHGMAVERHVPVHGKTSVIQHDARGVFDGLESPMTVMRYHSLVVRVDSVPTRQEGEDGWEVSAWVDEPGGDGVVRRFVMGLRRVWADVGKKPLEGVQFHPESYMTPTGARIIENFLRM